MTSYSGSVLTLDDPSVAVDADTPVAVVWVGERGLKGSPGEKGQKGDPGIQGPPSAQQIFYGTDQPVFGGKPGIWVEDLGAGNFTFWIEDGL